MGIGYPAPPHGQGLSRVPQGPLVRELAAATRWSPRSGASTRTCRRSGSSTTARPRAPTSARAASRPARSPRPSSRGLPAWRTTPTSPASARSSPPRSRTSRRAVRRSTTSTSSRSPTATRATTWRSRCAPCSPSSTGWSTSSSDRTLDEIGREEIVDAVARAALLGARGNSGVILTQFIRGAAEELASRPGELVDPTLVGSAMARSVDRAYASVRAPAEGTILTVAREMAHRIATELAHMHDPRLEPDAPDERSGRDDRRRARARARRRAGVGAPHARAAAGAARGGRRRRRRLRADVIFAGVIAALRGTRGAGDRAPRRARARHAPEHSRRPTATARTSRSPARTSTPRRWRDALEALGDSVLVVGDPHTLKVHVHTDDPEAATALFAGRRRDLAPRRRRHARAGRRARRAAGRQRHGPRPRPPPLRRARRASRRRACARSSRALGARSSTAARRSTRRPTSCSPASTTCRRGGRRAAELLERDHGRRARRRAVGEARPRRADDARSRPG